MDKELLLKPRLSEDEVELPGLGTVRVRGLSRVEVLMVRKATDDEHMDGPRVLTLERKLLATALLDPTLTEAEAGQWQQTGSVGEIQRVVERIQELSGMAEGAPKSGVPAVPGEPGDGVRVLPGTEAVDDGGPAAGADQ